MKKTPSFDIQTGENIDTLSYTQSRLDALGLSENDIKTCKASGTGTFKIISTNPDDADEMYIFYPALQGGLMTYEVQGTKYGGADDEAYSGGVNVNEEFYFARRHKSPKKAGQKYILPYGQPTRFFFPPRIVDAFCEKSKIHTLYVVEGQLKALKASVEGFDIVGISGIHNYKEGKSFELDKEFTKLIETCKVDRIVILHDADARQIKWQPQRELATRLITFYKAVLRFYELGAAYPNLHFFYAHIAESSELKGIDDLMAAHQGEKLDEIKQELKKVVTERRFDGSYIKGLKLMKKATLYQYFHLHSVEAFYGFYEQQLQSRTFKYKRTTYKRGANGKLRILSHPDAKDYIRVATKFYKFVNQELTAWDKTTILADYGNVPNFVSMVSKFDGFCNIPENNPDKYKHCVNNQYNKYRKTKYSPKEGLFPNIDMYIKHVFGEMDHFGHPRYEMAYDWLTILYTNPTHKLPIPVLASKKTGTGKSQFGFLLGEILGENATLIGNDEFCSGFNATFLDKVLVVIEEALLEKNLTLEKLKSYITNQTKVWLNEKNIAQSRIDCHLHFVLNTNNVHNFAPIDEDDTRFWVIEVPEIAEGQKNPDLLEDMKKEIPAFLHFLQTRKIVYPRKDRLWFAQYLLYTPEKQRVIDHFHSRSPKATMIEMIADICLETKEKTLFLPLEVIIERIKPNLKYPPSHSDLKRIFSEEGMAAPKIPERRNTPKYMLMSGSTNAMQWQIYNSLGRYWVFDVEKWLPADIYALVFPAKKDEVLDLNGETVLEPVF